MAKNALAANPSFKQVLLLQTTPRYNEKYKLNLFTQKKLEEAKRGHRTHFPHVTRKGENGMDGV